MKFNITAILIAVAAAASFGSETLASTTSALTPLPTPFRVLSPSQDAAPGSFTFVAGGDNRPTSAGDPQPPSAGEIFSEIGLIKPDLVIWTGDTIQGYDDDTLAQVDTEYGEFLRLAARTQCPIFNIPGNHEIGFKPMWNAEYKLEMGPDYGSFDYAGSHFVGLDSTPVEADGKIHEGVIDLDQLTWLKADLAANQGATNIFVFFHHYMYGPPDPDVPTSLDTGLNSAATRDMLHALFVQYHVRAVFNGHSHMFYHALKDGVNYYIAGNAGAPLDAAPENGGFLGYSLIHVDGKKLTVQNLAPWTLLDRTISGNDGKSNSATIAVSTYEYGKLTMRGLRVRMPQAASYSVSGRIRYKGKAPSVDVKITSTPLNPDGTETVFLTLDARAHRTTFLTVTANK